MAKSKNYFNSLPIPPLINKSFVGSIPQPIKNQDPYAQTQVKQDKLPSPDLTPKQIVDSVPTVNTFVLQNTNQQNLSAVPTDKTFTLNLANFKLARLRFAFFESPSVAGSCDVLIYSVKINGSNIISGTLTASSTTPSDIQYIDIGTLIVNLPITKSIDVVVNCEYNTNAGICYLEYAGFQF